MSDAPTSNVLVTPDDRAELRQRLLTLAQCSDRKAESRAMLDAVAMIDRLAHEPSTALADAEILADLDYMMLACPQIGRGLERAKKEIQRLQGLTQPPPAVHKFSVGDDVIVADYPAKVIGIIPTYRIQFSGKSGWIVSQEENMQPALTK